MAFRETVITGSLAGKSSIRKATMHVMSNKSGLLRFSKTILVLIVKLKENYD
jgi:hypothetical protein